jgi:hypothetical protein
MVKICSFCSEVISWPKIYSCFYCQKTYCDKHRLAENHECPKVMAAKHIEKDYLRRKGVNITTGRYAAVCKECGYKSDYYDIEQANEERINHIKNKGCSPKAVLLKQHEEDNEADRQLFESGIAHTKLHSENNDWMQECIDAAKNVIITFHTEYDTREFFKNSTFELYLQKDKETAYAYITINLNSHHFPIGVHPALSEDNSRNKRMLVVIFVHELLHAIHQDWGHEKNKSA